MTNRDWLCLGLRLIGIWMLIQAVEGMVPIFIYLFSGFNSFGGISTIVSAIVWLVGRTVFALVLVLFAPAIATRFYPQASPSVTSVSEINETKALRIGVQLLAVYALLLAVQSGSGTIYGLLVGHNASTFAYSEGSYLQSFMTCGLNLAFAAILLIWNERVIMFIAKFRYVAERDAYDPPSVDE
jgi:hypothetical protein